MPSCALRRCVVHRQALATIGLGDKDRLAIYTTVAAVLHLGNVAFEDNPEDRKGETRRSPRGWTRKIPYRGKVEGREGWWLLLRQPRSGGVFETTFCESSTTRVFNLLVAQASLH